MKFIKCIKGLEINKVKYNKNGRNCGYTISTSNVKVLNKISEAKSIYFICIKKYSTHNILLVHRLKTNIYNKSNLSFQSYQGKRLHSLRRKYFHIFNYSA